MPFAVLASIDDFGFLHAVARHAKEVAARDLAGVFVACYSYSGHLMFRLALEAPAGFSASATIGVHFPVAENLVCIASNMPVSILPVNGTDDPINPWGRKTQANEKYARHFYKLAHMALASETQVKGMISFKMGKM